MFLTSFIWGLGVSCGACFGLLLFFVLKAGLDWLLNTRAVKEAEGFAKLSLDALNRRNDLTEEQNETFERIAGYLQRMDEREGDND